MTVAQLAEVVASLAGSVDKLSRKVDGLISGKAVSTPKAARKAQIRQALANGSAVTSTVSNIAQPKVANNRGTRGQHFPAEPLPNGTTTVPANWQACFTAIVAELTSKGCGTVNYTFAQHPTEPKAGQYWLYLSFATKADAGKVKDWLKANYGFRFSMKHSDSKGGTSTWVCSGKMSMGFIAD